MFVIFSIDAVFKRLKRVLDSSFFFKVIFISLSILVKLDQSLRLGHKSMIALIIY